MNILIVSQYFWPENFRVNDLALSLKQKGHSVTVLTGKPNYPDGNFFDGYWAFSNSEEDFHGIRVRRVPLVSRGSSKGLRLALNYFSFAFFASLLGPFYCREKYNAIFVFEPSPITVGLPAIVLKKLTGTPIFFWVLDLWPESLSATGAVSSAFILKAVGGLVRFIYSRCDRILVSSKGFVNRVSWAGGAREKIFYFPNWTEEIYARAPEQVWPSSMPMPEGFKIIFAGNVGAAQSFPTILDAAENLKDEPDIHWIIIGDGRMLDWVKTQIKLRGLAGCVHLLGRHPPEDVVGLLAAADALLVTLKKDPVFSLTVPGKMQSYMACGKPIIACLDGEGAALIDESSSGLACPAENAAALAKAALALRDMSEEERKRMGENAARYCEANFNRAMLMDKLENWLKDTTKK